MVKKGTLYIRSGLAFLIGNEDVILSQIHCDKSKMEPLTLDMKISGIRVNCPARSKSLEVAFQVRPIHPHNQIGQQIQQKNSPFHQKIRNLYIQVS